jgi:negative regulator of flagellin synthesis FlgM
MIDRVGINGAGAVERAGRTATTPGQSTVGRTAGPAVVQAAGSPMLHGAISTVETLVAQGAPVDVAKVASIRAGIADGSYVVDPEAIAARMIEAEAPIR